MKLKKKPKIILITLIVLIALSIIGVVGYKMFFNKQDVKEVKILNTIKEYGYTLKDSKTKKYKTMFGELEEILNEKTVDEEKYVNKITQMFIYDFYSLDDKAAKTDVGGVEFVYQPILENFLQNAENTYYKYVESNIYNDRKQELPEVDEVTIKSVEQESYTYNETKDEKAYKVNVSWTYTDSKYDDYQKEATLVFIHDGIKLSLVELK